MPKSCYNAASKRKHLLDLFPRRRFAGSKSQRRIFISQAFLSRGNENLEAFGQQAKQPDCSYGRMKCPENFWMKVF